MLGPSRMATPHLAPEEFDLPTDRTVHPPLDLAQWRKLHGDLGESLEWVQERISGEGMNGED